LQSYESWKKTEDGILSIKEGAEIFNTIEKIKRFYPEFNGMITFEQKDVYRKSFHKTAPIRGRMDS
jgi:hypothetical protein